MNKSSHIITFDEYFDDSSNLYLIYAFNDYLKTGDFDKILNDIQILIPNRNIDRKINWILHELLRTTREIYYLDDFHDTFKTILNIKYMDGKYYLYYSYIYKNELMRKIPDSIDRLNSTTREQHRDIYKDQLKFGNLNGNDIPFFLLDIAYRTKNPIQYKTDYFDDDYSQLELLLII